MSLGRLYRTLIPSSSNTEPTSSSGLRRPFRGVRKSANPGRGRQNMTLTGQPLRQSRRPDGQANGREYIGGRRVGNAAQPYDGAAGFRPSERQGEGSGEEEGSESEGGVATDDATMTDAEQLESPTTETPREMGKGLEASGELQDLEGGSGDLRNERQGLHKSHGSLGENCDTPYQEAKKQEHRTENFRMRPRIRLGDKYDHLKQKYSTLRHDYRSLDERAKQLEAKKNQLHIENSDMHSEIKALKDNNLKLQAATQKMQKKIVEFTSQGVGEQRDDNYFARHLGSLTSSINQWSISNFLTKSSFPIENTHESTPETSMYKNENGPRSLGRYLRSVAPNVESIFSDDNASVARTKVINGAIWFALYTIYQSHSPFIGVPKYNTQLHALTEACGGLDREKHRLHTTATNLISRSPNFSSMQGSGLEQIAHRLNEMVAPFASPKSTSQSRYGKLLKIVQKFAQIALEMGQQDAVFTFEFPPLGTTFAPTEMTSTDGRESDQDLGDRKAPVEICECPAAYKRTLKMNGMFEEDSVLVSPMKVSCVGVPRVEKATQAAGNLTGSDAVQERAGAAT